MCNRKYRGQVWQQLLAGLVGWNFPNFRAPRPSRLLNSPDRQSPCSYRGTTSWSYDVQSCSGFHDRQRSSTSWRCRLRTCWTRGTAAAEGFTYFELVSIAICQFFFFFFFFFFYWLYNPGCVLVCSTILFHACLSSIFTLQPVIFILLSYMSLLAKMQWAQTRLSLSESR